MNRRTFLTTAVLTSLATTVVPAVAASGRGAVTSASTPQSRASQLLAVMTAGTEGSARPLRLRRSGLPGHSVPDHGRRLGGPPWRDGCDGVPRARRPGRHLRCRAGRKPGRGPGRRRPCEGLQQPARPHCRHRPALALGPSGRGHGRGPVPRWHAGRQPHSTDAAAGRGRHGEALRRLHAGDRPHLRQRHGLGPGPPRDLPGARSPRCGHHAAHLGDDVVPQGQRHLRRPERRPVRRPQGDHRPPGLHRSRLLGRGRPGGRRPRRYGPRGPGPRRRADSRSAASPQASAPRVWTTRPVGS